MGQSAASLLLKVKRSVLQNHGDSGCRRPTQGEKDESKENEEESKEKEDEGS